MKLHILGICGTFMGGVAALARELGHAVDGSDQNVYPPMSTQLEQLGIGLHSGYDPAHLAAVRDGLVAPMHGPTGTAARAAAGAHYLMAGKTGTAQRISRRGTERLDPNALPYHLRHQALFVGYAPADAPTIAVALVVEHGGSGSAAAAPVARRIFDAWMGPPPAAPVGPTPAVPPEVDPAIPVPPPSPGVTAEPRA